MDGFVGRGIGAYIGEYTPYLIIFGGLSYLITMPFSGINRVLLFIALTGASIAYVIADIHNMKIVLIVMIILSLLSIISKFLTRSNHTSDS